MTTNVVPIAGGGPIMVPLPDGAHALLRQPRTVPERLRRPVLDARNRMGAALPDLPPGTPDEATKLAFGRAVMARPDVMHELSDLLIVAMVASWSFEFPVSTEGLLDLPGESYDALKEACEKHGRALFPNFDPTDDATSPTVPSSD